MTMTSLFRVAISVVVIAVVLPANVQARPLDTSEEWGALAREIKEALAPHIPTDAKGYFAVAKTLVVERGRYYPVEFLKHELQSRTANGKIDFNARSIAAALGALQKEESLIPVMVQSAYEDNMEFGSYGVMMDALSVIGGVEAGRALLDIVKGPMDELKRGAAHRLTDPRVGSLEIADELERLARKETKGKYARRYQASADVLRVNLAFEAKRKKEREAQLGRPNMDGGNGDEGSTTRPEATGGVGLRGTDNRDKPVSRQEEKDSSLGVIWTVAVATCLAVGTMAIYLSRRRKRLDA